ncbi:unannotated protein [freshwater metagenome]|uniref:Unannotated protein n=1 Tax=freshwater metagenome TaxID=449393 RepID=A0A6J6Y3Z2_9ZZZZ
MDGPGRTEVNQPWPKAHASPNPVIASTHPRTAHVSRQRRPMNNGNSAVISRNQPTIPVPNGPVPKRKTSPSRRENPPFDDTPTRASHPFRKPRLQGRCRTSAKTEPPMPTKMIRPLPTNWPATQPPTANTSAAPETTTMMAGSMIAPNATMKPTRTRRCPSGRWRTPGPGSSPLRPKGASSLAAAS